MARQSSPRARTEGQGSDTAQAVPRMQITETGLEAVVEPSAQAWLMALVTCNLMERRLQQTVVAAEEEAVWAVTSMDRILVAVLAKQAPMLAPWPEMS